MTTTAPEAAVAPGIGIPFSVASRPQRRFSNVQSSVNNLAAAGSFQIVQLPATGWVRRLNLYFTQTTTGGVLGSSLDEPFNLITSITVTDATGQPIQQPISGYNLYLVNKYLGKAQSVNEPFSSDPCMSPEFTLTGTSMVWRLSIDFEVDAYTGYGCIPNLDSNASLQLKVDYAAVTVAVGSATAASLSMRVEQEYWAPVGAAQGGVPIDSSPPGAGDYREIRYETQPVSASAENLVSLTNRGGLVQGVILISRAAGVRTAPTALANIGVLLDNQPINEGIPIESHQNQVRRIYGYSGADLGQVAAPAAGASSGLDVGVIVLPFGYLSGGRSSWLNTRAGSLFQTKITPGASATTLEVVTGMMQVKDAQAFYDAR